MNGKKIGLVLLIVMWIGLASAATGSFSNSGGGSFGSGSASFVSGQYSPGFQTYYSGSAGDGLGSRASTYWPILGDRETCDARQDILIQVAPAGCQPSVVRSDLLAEQNVPVFCQIDALQINPLIKIDQIENIRFTGKYPKEIVGVGFHPARAALKTRDALLGSPLINNIGYVVVVMKKNEVEKNLPDFINVNLSAKIEYDATNALGVGRAEFILERVDDEEWNNVEKYRQSFFEGRYYVKLEEVDSNFATVSIYKGDQRITTVKVKKGETSKEIYLPGFYCRAALYVNYDGFIGVNDRATIEVGDGDKLDRIDVYKGSKILNGKCTVSDIKINSDTLGEVIINCPREKVTLKSQSIATQFESGETVRYYENSDNFKEVKIIEKTVNNQYKVQDLSNNAEIVVSVSKLRRIAEIGGAEVEIKENSLGTAEADNTFNDAVNAYEKIADEYPLEKVPNNVEPFGEQALKKAIILAEDAGKFETAAALMRNFLDIYPESEYASSVNNKLNRLYTIDMSLSQKVVEIDGKFMVMRLIDLKKADKSGSTAKLVHGTTEYNLHPADKQSLGIRTRTGEDGYIEISDITAESATIRTNCPIREDGRSFSTFTLYTQTDIRSSTDRTTAQVCGIALKLTDTEVKEIAKIRITPKAEGTSTETNLTVNIGIEKRAIKLNPDKTLDRIAELNKTIQKWEGISKNLAKVVTGLKSACFATSAVLTAKNFLTGLGGEALARQKVMRGENGWNIKCQQMVSARTYPTLDACYRGEADNINRDVKDLADIMGKDVNNKIESIEQGCPQPSGNGLFGGKAIDTNCAAPKYAQYIVDTYGTCNIKQGDKTLEVKAILRPNQYENAEYSYDDLREIETACKLQGKGGENSVLDEVANSGLRDSLKRIQDSQELNKEIEEQKSRTGTGLPNAIPLATDRQSNKIADITKVGDVIASERPPFGSGVTHVAYAHAVPTVSGTNTGATSIVFDGYYVLGLAGEDGSVYSVQQIYSKKSGAILSEQEKSQFMATYGIRNIIYSGSVTYANTIEDPKVQYYETEPYKGLPAIVPFDVQGGWYAATKQTLPAFGGQGAFDASGRVSSFWLCNVGTNKRIQFLQGFGDDICEQINVNIGQPYGAFAGLSKEEAERKVQQGIKALNDAANQYGNGRSPVSINGRTLPRDAPAPNIPATQCQDFMDPKDCHLMFNVCDPVICPTSRCNLGGNYYVQDVVQTGIVGSALLCLPNIREGIALPVCLTGIQAGIDSYVSILKSHRDCLQENVETGRMVGICDQIYSIYLCEFFWRQIAPVANILIPKLIESAYGQGTRGGGEYLTVNAAWQNMRSSIDYFTQSYAVNSLKAFKARSIEEAGGEFCKTFISAKAPKSFKSLVEPDSPPQFSAWFSATRFTTATAPATSQYKVFYHIFAGKDSGTYYSVYLKNPPESSFYVGTPTVQVASGFIQRGDYKTETRDFTAPEGYQELCVRINDEERCGFKQVSTDFAVNYLRDQYAKEQITQSNIATEQECISGSPSAGALLANTNPQSALEEATLPANYQRGIVRICATNNPGSSTEPARFVNVGFCTDQKVRCWLDQNSVDKAITSNDILVKNQTLDELRKIQSAALGSSGALLEGDAIAEIENIDAAATAVNGKDSAAVRVKAKIVIDRIDLVLTRIVYNHQKAHLLFIRAQVLEKVTRSYWKDKEKATPKATPDKVDAATQAPIDNANNVPVGDDPATSSLNLGTNFDIKNTNKNYINYGKSGSGLYFYQDRVYYDVSFLSHPFTSDVIVGTIRGNKITVFLDRFKQSENVVPKEDYSITEILLKRLDKATIEGNKINEVISENNTPESPADAVLA